MGALLAPQEETFQIRMVWSELPAASKLPSGEKAEVQILGSNPERVTNRPRSERSKTFRVRWVEAASLFPFRDTAREMVEPFWATLRNFDAVSISQKLMAL